MNAPAIIPRMVEIAGEQNAYKFGKIIGEPIEEYHNCGALSKPREKGEALLIGGAIDTMALEGMEAFKARYCCEPDDSPKRPTKPQLAALKKSPAALESIAYWERYDRENKGKEALTDKQAALVQRCADALHANKTFARLFQLSKPQITFRIRGSSFALQCRPDLWAEDGTDLTDGAPCITDVKTIAELPADDPEHIPKHIGMFGYHRGAYLYPEIVRNVMNWREDVRTPFVLAFVEKREPHAVLCRPVGGVSRDIGEREISESLTRIRKCMAENYWPESWDPQMSEVELSPYYVRKALENTDGNLWG
jgi:hypothetical protein